MTIDQILNPIRPILQLAGTGLILLGLFKLAGGSGVPVSGESWQLAILGWTAKQI